MGLVDSVRLWHLVFAEMNCRCVNGPATFAMIQFTNLTTDSYVVYLVVCEKCKSFAFVAVPYQSEQFELLTLEMLTNEKNGYAVQ